MTAQINTESFADWIGRTWTSDDTITPRLVESFRSIFDPFLAPAGDDIAPLGLHWCLSPAIVPMVELGSDGHAARNTRLPPIPLPRRMWAGGEVEYLGPLHVGDRVSRTSLIRDVCRKDGRSGELWFVTVDNEYSDQRGLAVRERQDIVYRAAARGENRDLGSRPSDPDTAAGAWTVDTPSTLLFRYSAITYNAHRIHYDLPYATEVEGYDGLIVHGPLQATLLLNLAAITKASIPIRFSYRALSPAVAGWPLAVHSGKRAFGNTFWTESNDGGRHMEASVPEPSRSKV